MPEGFDYHVKTAADAVAALQSGEVEYISFDHDLGDEVNGTGYDVAKWIEEKAFNNEVPRLRHDVHSSNPSGAANIVAAMNQADAFWDRNEQKRQGIKMGGVVNSFFKKTAQVKRTPFEELKIRPKSVPEEEVGAAPVASPEIATAYHSLKIAQKNLQDLENSIKQATIAHQKQIEQMKQQEGYEQKASELQNKIEEMRGILAQLSTAENVVVSLEDSYMALENKMKDVSFKPVDRWKVEKLLERFGKEAEQYLENAIRGAQSMAKQEPFSRIVTFPKKSQAQTTVSSDLMNFTKALMRIQTGIEHILEGVM